MRKIRFWELWDWKSITGVISTFGLLLSIFLFSEYGSDFSRKNKVTGKTVIVEGQLDSIKPFSRMHQSQYSGNSIIIDYYELNYSYILGGQNFFGSEKISNNNANNNFLEKLLNGKTKKIPIEVESSNYTKSRIIIQD